MLKPDDMGGMVIIKEWADSGLQCRVGLAMHGANRTLRITGLCTCRFTSLTRHGQLNELLRKQND